MKPFTLPPVLFIASMLLLSGCASKHVDTRYPGFFNLATSSTAFAKDFKREGEVWGYSVVSLKAQQPSTLNGIKFNKGDRVHGLVKRGCPSKNRCKQSWVYKPQFQDLRLWDDRFFYAKPYGKDVYYRYSLGGMGSGKEATDITRFELALVTTSIFVNRGIEVGVRQSPTAADLLEVVIFDEQGFEAFRVDRVVNSAFSGAEAPVIPVDPSGKAFVVHHQMPDGNRAFIIYNRRGTPISPDLAEIALLPMEHRDVSTRRQMAIRLDVLPEMGLKQLGELYWPVNEEGMILPLPEDLLGVRPIYYYHSPGKRMEDRPAPSWGVLWRTEQGNRWAYLPSSATVAEMIDSRGQAKWDDVYLTRARVESTGEQTQALMKLSGTTSYMRFEEAPHRYDSDPRRRTGGLYATVDEGIRAMSRRAEALRQYEKELAQQRWEAYQNSLKYAAYHAQRDAEERQRLLDTVNFAMNGMNLEEGLRLAKSANLYREAGVIIGRMVVAGYAAELSDADLVLGRDYAADKATRQRIQQYLDYILDQRAAAVARTLPRQSSRFKSEWRGFSSGRSSGSSGGGWSSYNASEIQWQQKYNYLRGNTTSYPGQAAGR